MRALLAALILAVSIPVQAVDFDQLRVYAVSGTSEETWHGQAHVQAVNFELATVLSPRTELAIVIAPTVVRQPQSWFGYSYGNGDENIGAVSTSFLVRRLFHVDSSSWRWYAEVAGGPLWGQKRIPAATSHFNFVSQGGAGVILRPASPLPIMLGYRFQHISNGGAVSRNPGLNVSALVLGVRFGK